VTWMTDDTRVVHLCRHGKVENPKRVLYSRLPGFHLSERGRDMAQRLGDHFANMPLTHLRVSPLERAQETMAPIAARHPDLPVVVDWRLIEADSSMQGQAMGPLSIGLARPSNWHYFVRPSRSNWGEPNDTMAARMLAAIADAAHCAGPGGRAVMVSHQAPIWVTRCFTEGRHLFNIPLTRQCALASVTTFTVAGDGSIEFVSYEDIIG